MGCLVTLLTLVSALGLAQPSPRYPVSSAPLASAAKPNSPSAVIDTLAGGGNVGDGGLATLARFNLPGGVTEAPNGDVVVVDFGNHRVRLIDRKTGIIRTIAGTGEAGYNGDNIPADQARLTRPEFAVFNSDGDLYIADSYNNRIRRVSHVTGLISTVAGTGERGFSGDGGAATSANLHFPEGIAVDFAGNLFISDTVNRRIRRVDARTGIIETYAGTGSIATNAEGTPAANAGFLRLARIAVDRSGNVYVADSPSHRLLFIDAKTRLMRTFAGTGKPGFSGDGEQAVNAELSFPEGVVVAPNQDIYFADVGNHRARKIDARTGIISTVAGTGDKGFSGDGGPANLARLWSPGRVWVGSSGDLIIADILNARIRRVDAKTHVIKTIAGTGDWGDGGQARNALLSVPGDVVFSAGKVFIADYGTRRVRCVDLATGIISTVAGGGTRSGDGIPAIEADLLLPEGIAVDSGRMLYIADNISNRVWKVDLKTGLLTRFAGGGKQDPDDEGIPATSARLQMPSALAVGASGVVYISEFGSQKVREVDPATGVMRTVSDSNGPLKMAVSSLDASADGLFMLTHDSNQLRLFDLRRRRLSILPQIDSLPLPSSGDTQLIDIAVHGDDAYLADPLAHRVIRVNMLTADATVVAGSGVEGFSGDNGPAGKAALFMPGGVAVSDDGREIYIADTKNHRIRRVRMSSEAAPASAPGKDSIGGAR